MILNDEKLTRKELYNELWKGRDLELTNLWQRSIFLISFLVISFTAYCGLWIGLFKDESSSIKELLVYNLSFIVIALFGLSTSCLWLMMTKGSKYWYEKYEGSISKVIEDGSINSPEINYDDYESKRYEFINNDCEEMGVLFSEYPVYYPRHGYLSNIAMERGKVCNCLVSTKAGAYSVTKINIGIGLLTGFIWILLIIVHIVTYGLLRVKLNAMENSHLTFLYQFIKFNSNNMNAMELLINSAWSGRYAFAWISFPLVFIFGFLLMIFSGLFSSSESKKEVKKNLKRKIKYYCVNSEFEKRFIGYLNSARKYIIKTPIRVPKFSEQPFFLRNIDKRWIWAIDSLEVLDSKALCKRLYCLNYRELSYIDTLLDRLVQTPCSLM